jgi:hypothetical protein
MTAPRLWQLLKALLPIVVIVLRFNAVRPWQRVNAPLPIVVVLLRSTAVRDVLLKAYDPIEYAAEGISTASSAEHLSNVEVSVPLTLVISA